MPITASRPPTFVGCAPSYIRVIPDTLANLPAIDFDHIPLPDGTTVHALKPSSRVTPAHAANLATITWGATTGIGFGNGGEQGTPGHPCDRWCFQGIRFKAAQPSVSASTVNSTSAWMLIQAQLDPQDFGTPGMSGHPTRVIFNQCWLNADSGNYGQGHSEIAELDMEYFGFVNSWCDGNWEWGSGNVSFYSAGNAPGPYHIENCTVPNSANEAFFTGGGASAAWPMVPSITLRRNDLSYPPAWRPSEGAADDARSDYGAGGGNGFTFTVGGGGLTLTRVAGTTGWNWTYNAWRYPLQGGFVYDPATGVARQLAADGNTDGAPYHVTLTSAWPAADGTTLVGIYYQNPSPLVLFQSGVAGQLAHTTAGSRTVTLDTALPTTSMDGSTVLTASLAPETGPFFYTNDTAARGDCAFNRTTTPSGRTVYANDWGRGAGYSFQPGIAAPYHRPRYDPAFNGTRWADLNPTQQAAWNANSCRRRVEIVAISGDRKTLTLASPYFETTDFTFSIVQGDGLVRLGPSSAKGKGYIELKVADRCLFEGNVADGPLPSYGAPQSNDFNHLANISLVGDTLTLLPGGDITTWPAALYQTVARYQTYGYFPGTDPHTYAGLQEDGLPRRHALPYLVFGNVGGYGTMVRSRVVKSLDSPTTATLEPIDPRYNGTDVITPGTGVTYFRNTNPFWRVGNVVSRYNIVQLAIGSSGFGQVLMGGHGEAPGEIANSRNWIIHDQLHVEWNPAMTLRTGASGLTECVELPVASHVPVHGLVALGADWTNSYARISHNTSARALSRGPRGLVNPTFGADPTTEKASYIEVCDNIVEAIVAPFGYNFGAITAADVATFYRQPFRADRNILIAPTAPADTAGCGGDNVGFTARTPVGFPSALTGVVSLDPADYALVDIYTTGTVSIDSAGTTVTLGSGTFPSDVVAGQFFRLASKTTLIRIATVASTTLTLATAYPFAPVSNEAYAITFKGTATDGADPGADMTLLKQFTDGVRITSY